MQANLQRKKLATQELLIEAEKQKTCFALVQEPYIGSKGEVKQYSGTRVVQRTLHRTKPIKAAIIVFDEAIEVVANPMLTTENIAVAILKTSDWTMAVLSIYFEDSLPIDPYLDEIKRICSELKMGKLIIGGDGNAWSTWWGSVREDHRGEALAGTMDELELQILNVGDEPTFDTIRGDKEYRSHVDITACTGDLLGKVHHWKVDKGITSSDHNTITFEIKLSTPRVQRQKFSTRIYSTRKANWEEFKAEFTKLREDNLITKAEIDKIDKIKELENKINIYIKTTIITCDKTIPKIKKKTKSRLPWWSKELENLKNIMVTKKRRIRCAAPRRRDWVIREYLKEKENYEHMAEIAQTESWKSFCNKQDRESMWDGIYRVIASTSKAHQDELLLKDGKVLDPVESVKLLAEVFFPDDKKEDDTLEHEEVRRKADSPVTNCTDAQLDPPFTEAELKHAMLSFAPKKAPGPDGLTADICVAAISENTDVFLGLINKCLELSHFPTAWKEAAVVVLRKPGKENYNDPKSYRPIGLLSIMGKILEKILMRRIRWHVLPKANPKQYGFVPQRSTEDALFDLIAHIRKCRDRKLICVIVSLDIEGAFDSAWWPAVKCRLVEKGCPVNLRRLVNSYLENRKVSVRYADSTYTKETTKGCVQGSIGGPIFWNMLLDPLLDSLDGMKVHYQAFADDVVLVFSGQTGEEIERQGNGVLKHVYEWGVKNKLKFAPHKTNAMVVTRKMKFDDPRLRMGGRDILLVKDMKILGLTIDHQLTFNKHVSLVCRKATNIYKAMARSARVSWGLNPQIIRTMYVAVIEPIIMYAASSWAGSTTKICVQKLLNTVQRGFAQKITKSYRTVSLNAAITLARLLPLDLRIQEAARLYEVKRGLDLDATGGREVETKAKLIEAPHPSEETDVTFECLEDVSPETVAKYCISGKQFYTDGSKIQNRVGAALSCWNGATEMRYRKFKLEPCCTVFQAELYALLRATEEALSWGETNIFSDSRSALELVQDRDSFHPLVRGIRGNLTRAKEQGKNIRLFWIRAHVGVTGNERADELAKDAALHKKTASDYDKCPVSFAKRIIRSDTLQKWNHRYESGGTAAVTKMFLPNAEEAYRVLAKMDLNPVRVQLLTGHGGFSSYLHRFKCKDSPSCICEPDAEETIEHLLLECPKYSAGRMDLQIQLESTLKKESIKDIMANSRTRDLFLKYCEGIATDVINRNKTK